MQLDDGFEGEELDEAQSVEYLAACLADAVLEQLRPVFADMASTMIRGLTPLFVTLGEELDRKFSAQLALSQELVDLLQRAVDESSAGPS